MLTPPEHAMTREAMFIFGALGSAKSTIWDTIAHLYRLTGTPGHFHIISTEPERAYVIVEPHKDWRENITVYEPERNYESLLEVSQSVHAVGTKEDWIVVDSIGSGQDWIRNNWFEANKSKTWKQFQADGGDPKSLEAHNWTQMNEMYKAWMLEYVMGFGGHRIAIAQGENLHEVTNSGKDWDKGHVRDTYGRIGKKPVGYKFDDFYFHSVFYASSPASQEYALRTVKDKPGRQYLTGERVAELPMGFVQSYLLNVAGWSLTPEDWTVLLPLMRGDAS